MGLHQRGEIAHIIGLPDAGDADGFEEAVSEALQRRAAEHAPGAMTEPFDRPLHDAERSLLGFLAARTVAEQDGCTLDEAFDALSRAAGEGQVVLDGDAVDVRIILRGKVLVHCARDWLAFRASWPGEDPWQDHRWLT